MCQKFLDHAKQSTGYASETTSKRAIQKTAEAAGDLIGNKINYKVTGFRKKSTTKKLRNSYKRA